MRSQVTTKRGDRGESTALSGGSFPKSHPIMECVGTLDELRAQLALARLEIIECRGDPEEQQAAFLAWLLNACFALGAQCSDPVQRKPEFHAVTIEPRHVTRIEEEQARLEEIVTLPSAFIASAANRESAQVDVACTVARRFERALVRLKEAYPESNLDAPLVFVNRLSDYLYILARHLEGGEHHVVDYKVL